MDLKISSPQLALLTDLYQLTMVQGYWKAGLADVEAVFHLNFRKKPFQGGFAIAAGLQTAIEFIQHFRFSEQDIAYLSNLTDPDGASLFETKFLEALRNFQCTCDIDAIPEGTAVFPYEPMIRVKGPLWQAQLLESPLLNLINFQTLIATKSARICLAAGDDPVVEFGMRRAQGVDGALSASRAAFIGGCAATSDVLAGKLFGIPVRGTHGHSWVMAFPNELQAFRSLAETMPKKCVLLVDTYDAVSGVKHAMRVADECKSTGFILDAVRLDSGDLFDLSIEIRKLLDSEGFFSTQIMASNELDEYAIRDLKQRGAKIDAWGVGTNLVTGGNQSALDGIYKLSALSDGKNDWQYKLKVSETASKTTNPGILQVRRSFDGEHYLGDVIYDELLGAPKGDGRDLLVPIFRDAKLVYKPPNLHEIQRFAAEELARLSEDMKRLENAKEYPVAMEKRLQEKKQELIRTSRLV